MSLVRYSPSFDWTPFDSLATLRDEVNRLFDSPAPTRETSFFSGWAPALDLYDDKENLVVVVEVPGMKKEDINLSLHEGVLTVSGERRRASESGEPSKPFRSERTFGKFQRSITLPARVDSGKVTAGYKDGVLTVTLPKAEEAKPRQIDVSVN